VRAEPFELFARRSAERTMALEATDDL